MGNAMMLCAGVSAAALVSFTAVITAARAPGLAHAAGLGLWLVHVGLLVWMSGGLDRARRVLQPRGVDARDSEVAPEKDDRSTETARGTGSTAHGEPTVLVHMSRALLERARGEQRAHNAPTTHVRIDPTLLKRAAASGRGQSDR